MRSSDLDLVDGCKKNEVEQIWIFDKEQSVITAQHTVSISYSVERSKQGRINTTPS